MTPPTDGAAQERERLREMLDELLDLDGLAASSIGAARERYQAAREQQYDRILALLGAAPHAEPVAWLVERAESVPGYGRLRKVTLKDATQPEFWAGGRIADGYTVTPLYAGAAPSGEPERVAEALRVNVEDARANGDYVRVTMTVEQGDAILAALETTRDYQGEPPKCISCEDSPRPPNVPCAACGAGPPAPREQGEPERKEAEEINRLHAILAGLDFVPCSEDQMKERIREARIIAHKLLAGPRARLLMGDEK